MNEQTQTIVEYRLRRASETLDEARFVLSGGYAANAANRLDYACFYAVSALLAAEQRSAKSHKGVHVLFHQEYVKQGRISIEHGTIYSQLLHLRQEGDYEDFIDIDLETVQGYVRGAENFVQDISTLIKNLP